MLYFILLDSCAQLGLDAHELFLDLARHWFYLSKHLSTAHRLNPFLLVDLLEDHEDKATPGIVITHDRSDDHIDELCAIIRFDRKTSCLDTRHFIDCLVECSAQLEPELGTDNPQQVV